MKCSKSSVPFGGWETWLISPRPVLRPPFALSFVLFRISPSWRKMTKRGLSFPLPCLIFLIRKYSFHSNENTKYIPLEVDPESGCLREL